MLKDTFIGLWTTSINDALRTGNYKYAELCKEAANKFKCKNKQRDNLKCSSSQIRSSENIFPIHENEYILRLQKLLISSKFSIFRYLDAKAAWVTNARPAKGFPVAKITKFNEENIKKNPYKCIKSINDISRIRIHDKQIINFMSVVEIDAFNFSAIPPFQRKSTWTVRDVHRRSDTT